jgi:hypothetical protein
MLSAFSESKTTSLTEMKQVAQENKQIKISQSTADLKIAEAELHGKKGVQKELMARHLLLEQHLGKLTNEGDNDHLSEEANKLMKEGAVQRKKKDDKIAHATREQKKAATILAGQAKRAAEREAAKKRRAERYALIQAERIAGKKGKESLFKQQAFDKRRKDWQKKSSTKTAQQKRIAEELGKAKGEETAAKVEEGIEAEEAAAAVVVAAIAEVGEGAENPPEKADLWDSVEDWAHAFMAKKMKAPPSEQKARARSELMYQGTKFFWRSGQYVDVFMYRARTLNRLTLICLDTGAHTEFPKIYVDIDSVKAHLDMKKVETVVISPELLKNVLGRDPAKESGYGAAAKVTDEERTLIVDMQLTKELSSYLLSRLQLVKQEKVREARPAMVKFDPSSGEITGADSVGSSSSPTGKRQPKVTFGADIDENKIDNEKEKKQGGGGAASTAEAKPRITFKGGMQPRITMTPKEIPHFDFALKTQRRASQRRQTQAQRMQQRSSCASPRVVAKLLKAQQLAAELNSNGAVAAATATVTSTSAGAAGVGVAGEAGGGGGGGRVVGETEAVAVMKVEKEEEEEEAETETTVMKLVPQAGDKWVELEMSAKQRKQTFGPQHGDHAAKSGAKATTEEERVEIIRDLRDNKAGLIEENARAHRHGAEARRHHSIARRHSFSEADHQRDLAGIQQSLRKEIQSLLVVQQQVREEQQEAAEEISRRKQQPSNKQRGNYDKDRRKAPLPKAAVIDVAEKQE